MVNVTMRADNVVDCGRTDLCLVEAAKETTGRRAERLRSAHATVEHDEPAARIQEQHVLLEDKIVSRQEVVGECLGQFLLSWTFQRSGWLSQWQRPVGDHGCLKLADHEAIEIGDLAADDWGAGLAGWNAKARGRSKADGRRAKKHRASGDRRVGHMHFLPGWYSPMIVEPAVAENGYIESFNARLRDELLNGEIFYTLREAQIVIESWRRHYNTIRPHASIGYKPPAPEVFVPAFAAWPAALRRPAPPATLAQPPTLN